MTLNYHAGLKPTNATATPIFRNLLIENVRAHNVEYAVSLFCHCQLRTSVTLLAQGLYDGLPEQHVLNMTLRNVTVTGYKSPFLKCDFVDGTCEAGTNPCPPCFAGAHPPPLPPPPPPPPLKQCELAKVQGCYNDSASKVLSFSTTAVHDHVTQGNCAAVCNQQSLPIAGIDQGNHCQCGTLAELTAAKGRLLPAEACDTGAWPCTGVCCGQAAPKGCALGKCTGKPSEHCGGKGAVVAYTYRCEKAVQPGDAVP